MSITRTYLCFLVLSVFLSGCSISRHENTVVGTDPAEASELPLEGIDKEIADKESEYGIPPGLLKSISFVESNSKPFAVNSKKKSHYFSSKKDAVQFIKKSVASGHRNLSVGCFQLHYGSHNKRFRSIDEMVSPKQNIEYAAKLLKRLHDQYGSWEKAIKKYHAGNPRHNKVYYAKVMRTYNSSR